jgi:nitroreductase
MNPNPPNQSLHVDGHKFIPYCPERLEPKTMTSRATAFNKIMQHRRSTRYFSDEPVPKEVIAEAIDAASSAPSGAHKQPWTFCLVSSLKIKTEIRQKAEAEEYESYNSRMNEQWLEDLAPLGTDHIKPYLEQAPYLIVVFKKTYEMVNGKKRQNYYVSESVGIAVGVLLSALQHAGLATLTHTPSPMKFLGEILNRPSNEKPFLLIPVGYASDDAMVPDLQRKPLEEVLCEYE